MSNTFKRRIFRLSFLSVTCFLLGITLDDLNTAGIGIQNSNVTLYTYFLIFAGVLLGFKALDIWSAWEEDRSVDTAVVTKNSYPMLFYTEASIFVLLSLFLLTVTYIRNTLNVDEVIMVGFSLLIGSISWCIGHLSTSIQ